MQNKLRRHEQAVEESAAAVNVVSRRLPLQSGVIDIEPTLERQRAVTDAQTILTASPPGLVRRFREELATEFGEPVRVKLDQALFGDPQRNIKPHKPGRFVGRLRRALALATLRHQPPDLVILDEFQRYRQLLDESEANPLLKALLEPEGPGTRPAILLLSTTPYPHLTTRWEEARGVLAQKELLKLIGFLAGTDACDHAKTLFSDFGDQLHEVVAHADANSPQLREKIAEVVQIAGALRTLLTPVMSRTERDSVASVDLARTDALTAEPSAEDFQVYRHLAESFTDKTRFEALPYWSSVPLPAQSLGPRYAAWKARTIKAVPRKLTRMTRERRNKLDAPMSWPDAKLRALSKIAPTQLLALPWVAPSLPW